MTPNGVTRQTPIANFNQGYLNVLGSAGQEYALFLTGAGCTVAQIENIADPSMNPCTNAELAAGADTCSCCTLPDQVNLQDYTGLLMEYSICNSLATELDSFTQTTAKDGMKLSFAASGVPSLMDAATYNALPAGPDADPSVTTQDSVATASLIALTGQAEPTTAQLNAAAVVLILDGAGYQGMWDSFKAAGVPSLMDATTFNDLDTATQMTTVDSVIAATIKANIAASFGVAGVPNADGSALTYTAVEFNAMDGATQSAVVDGTYDALAAADPRTTMDSYEHAVKRGAVATGLNMDSPTGMGLTTAGVPLDTATASDEDVFYWVLLSKGAQYCACKSGDPIDSGGCCLEKGMIPETADSTSATYLTYDGGTNLADFFCDNTLSTADDGTVANTAVSADDMAFPFTNGYYYASVAGKAAGLMPAVVPPNRNCVNMINENSGIMSLVNFLSGIDGGADITAAKNRDGTTFAGDKFGNPKTWTPLIQTHSANDHLYGYPSALLGAMVPMLVLNLPGQAIDAKKAQLAGIGAYTAGFQAVCEAGCTDPTGTAAAAAPGGWTCAGNAADRETLADTGAHDALMFADNDCKPLSWTYSTKMFCGAIEAGVADTVYGMCKDGFASSFAASGVPSVMDASSYNALPAGPDADLSVITQDSVIESSILALAGSADAKTSYCTTTVLAGAGYQGMIDTFAALGICTDYADSLTCSVDAATFTGMDAATQAATVDSVIATGIKANIAASFGVAGVPNADGSALTYTADEFNAMDGATQSAVVDGTYDALAAADPRTILTGYENEAKLGAAATGLSVSAKAADTTLWAEPANLAALVEAYAISVGTEYCTCYDGAHGFANMPATGCCLANGNTGSQDLTGFGCLYAHPGHYVSRLAGEGTSSLNLEESMTRAKATAGADQVASDGAVTSAVKSKKDMCPADGGLLANMVEYEDKTSYPASRSGATQSVQGGNGRFFKPQGLTGSAGDTHISTLGTNIGDTASLYVSQVVREITLEYVGDEEFFGTNTAKYTPNAKMLWSTTDGGIETDSNSVDVGAMAAGTCGKADSSAPCEGYNGAQHAGVASGTGLPVYLNQPMFLNADAALLDSAVNNVEIYHCFDYVGAATYEGFADLPSKHTDNVWSLDDCDLVNAAFLTSHKDDLDVYILVEPATGMAISGHKRLSLSMSPVTDCDITNDATCALGITATGVLGSCHSAVAGAFWSSITLPTTLTAAQTFAMMYGAESSADYAPGSPCSQANVLTPAFKGGNLMPLWWVDQAADATEDGMDASFNLLNKFLELCGTIQMAAIAAGAVLALIGGACIAMGGGGGNKVTAAA
ncbi:hypothetical protein TrLO_g12990 [Triparma laevis f. longispina]|uniref:Uncharacterized protein n=1 Tax=Triparma laevis f. longispina TaxID=1714387 RepID=A0A9W7KV93_9STRA|nr:hypothetical protein TrLO_g12990 [Triparma laevis f. longispina]